MVFSFLFLLVVVFCVHFCVFLFCLFVCLFVFFLFCFALFFGFVCFVCFVCSPHAHPFVHSSSSNWKARRIGLALSPNTLAAECSTRFVVIVKINFFKKKKGGPSSLAPWSICALLNNTSPPHRQLLHQAQRSKPQNPSRQSLLLKKLVFLFLLGVMCECVVWMCCVDVLCVRMEGVNY